MKIAITRATQHHTTNGTDINKQTTRVPHDHTRKNPIHLNEGFKCEHCHKKNPTALKSCRNHCISCLYSKHVDENVPGDRLSNCLGLMLPLIIEKNGKKGYQILHQCLKCGKEILNKTAEDDDIEAIIKIMKNQNSSIIHPNP